MGQTRNTYSELGEDLIMIGGERYPEQRLWAHVLKCYIQDLLNKDKELYDIAVQDLMESMKSGDLKLVCAMAGVKYETYLNKIFNIVRPK